MTDNHITSETIIPIISLLTGKMVHVNSMALPSFLVSKNENEDLVMVENKNGYHIFDLNIKDVFNDICIVSVNGVVTMTQVRNTHREFYDVLYDKDFIKVAKESVQVIGKKVCDIKGFR